MKAQQERLERFDRENEYLGDPLVPPKKKEGDKEEPIVDLFLRPPRGIQPTPDKKQGDLIFRYPASNPCLFQEFHLAVAVDEKDFASDVLRAFPGLDPTPTRVTKNPPGRPPLPFNLFKDAQGTQFVYLFQRGKDQVGLIFRVMPPRPGTDTTQAARTAMDLCLESLAVGFEAQPLRYAYEQQRRRPAPIR